jgi:hypothetical protein
VEDIPNQEQRRSGVDVSFFSDSSIVANSEILVVLGETNRVLPNGAGIAQGQSSTGELS